MEVKKLWSLNPRRYKVISLKKASEQHLEWVFYNINRGNTTYVKDFKTWLKTEI